ncbi:glucosaminidase domain-containing protein [Pseudomonas mangiferae]|uniref:glucosaminidase domain-containing protein n=1 Tax=Pseudomonas mangiferae TaxID=2593654 RepID=UPI001C49BAE0|nr:glucosaminidase domain-containing protein [Pseudomonas mangiferae]
MFLSSSAQESQYGSGRIARDYHNYFSMHAPALLQVGEGEARNNPSVRLARYSSFGQAAESFAARYGASVRGVKDVHQFANALVRAGFNSGDDMNGGKTGFANYLIGIIGMVKIRMECES